MAYDFNLDRVAHLARIAITAEEKNLLAPRLEKVMQLIDDLKQIDTTGIAPMVTPLQQYQIQRPDEVTAADHHEIYQKLAPKVAGDLYLVPQVIE
jgi:aspartyl-tRNA(Asn)/glutamyl-tRNA(Gln) amidotransferase subunit C